MSCLLANVAKLSNIYRGPSIDTSYQVSVHLAKQLQRRRFQKLTNQKQELPATSMFLTHCEMSTFQRCFLPNFSSFGKAVAEEKIFQKSTNQKQELSVAAMFVNRSGRNVQSLQRISHRCFLPSFSSFGRWQNLTFPLARKAKNAQNHQETVVIHDF